MKKEVSTKTILIDSADQIKTLERKIKNLSKENERYVTFFENTPISLWIEDFSELKKYVEKKAKEHNKNISSYINENPSIISKMASLVEIKEVNTATLNLYKAKSKQELLNNLNKIFTKDSSEGFVKLVTDLLSGTTASETETIHKTLEGDEFDILLKFKIAKGSEKTFKNVIVSVEDITERINSKKLLETSEKKFRNFFEKSKDAVLVIKNRKLIDCNLAAVKTFGYLNKQDLLNTDLFKLAPEILPNGSIAHEKAQKMMQIALIEGNKRFRCHHLNKNGFIFPSEVTITRLDENDLNSVLQIVIRDITEQIKQEELEDVLYNISRAALTISDFKKFGYFIKEELQKIIDTNNFFIAMYNEVTDMISTPVFVDEKEEVEEFSAKDSLTGYVIKTKKSLIINKEEHKKRVNEGIVSLIGMAAEKWLGVPLIIKDKVIGAIVVQSYTNENAYNENDVNLLEFVADQISTTILRKKTDEDLKKALIKAKESDKLKSAFLANMSHEIRTPMNGIIGFSEFFLEPNLSEFRRKEYAKVVINSGKRLLSIVNDILDISKIEAGEIKLNYKPVSLNKLLNELYVFYKPKAEENNLELNCVKGLDNFKNVIEIDNTKLSQVLTNLLSNAFKFTKKGSIEFGYQLIEEKLQFYVKDTGIGIEKKLQDHIFDRFTQANIDLVKKHKGTGLGLAISKKLVELFEGEIWLDSDNNGTTMYFTIPFIKSKSSQITTVIQEPKQDIQVKNKELTILVAEDEEYNMMYINELFSQTKFKVIEADNGKKAVELFQKHPEIDLVLMDIKMPIMNGNEAMKEIKQQQPNLPIIALSAFAMESDKEASLKEGFNDYLTKPINKKLLFEAIDKFS
jgi:PAS domain S-box-containing protein